MVVTTFEVATSEFTFHYVSINSNKSERICDCGRNLHSIMSLLILHAFRRFCCGVLWFTFHYVSINSAIAAIAKSVLFFEFTFHYVSINSENQLLIFLCGLKFTFHYVSINSPLVSIIIRHISPFTFHYVSINSNKHLFVLFPIFYLHSIMSLLIQGGGRGK